jgi:hypothetical protein
MMDVRTGEPMLRQRSACVSQETDMEEHGTEYVGTLFVLPASRAFELNTTLHGLPVTLTGTIAQHLAAQFAGNDAAGEHIDVRQLSVQPRRVEILTRDIHERHRAPRKVHFLMRVIDGGVHTAHQDASVTA